MPDIDIDFADRSILLNKIKHRIAKLDSGKKHNTGVYFTEVPHDPINNLCTIDYEKAEQRGYFKIDCLNVSIYTTPLYNIFNIVYCPNLPCFPGFFSALTPESLRIVILSVFLSSGV